MLCQMVGCNHRTRLSPQSQHVGQSWTDYGICSCCAMELVKMEVISGAYRFSGMCNKRNNSTQL